MTAGGHLVKTPAWGLFIPGMEVKVDGEPRRYYRWVAHVRNTRTGEEWADLIGGKPGTNHGAGATRLQRSVALERVKPVMTVGRATKRRVAVETTAIQGELFPPQVTR